MYFVPLMKIDSMSKETVRNFDECLKQLYAHGAYFTPVTIAREINISEDEAWELVFQAEGLGVLTRAEVKKCKVCQKTSLMHQSCSCEKPETTEGYMFTMMTRRV